MKTKTLVVGYVLALALFLFAQRHHSGTGAAGPHTVIDLTYPIDSQSDGTPFHFVQVAYGKDRGRIAPVETWMKAPAQVADGLWTMDQIPPARLVASLVVMDVRENVRQSPGYQLSVMDIANWERNHGEIPLGSVVMLLTGSTKSLNRNPAKSSAGFSADAAKFLVEGREAIGLGIDLPEPSSLMTNNSAMSSYALSHSSYLLYNVANLENAPVTGGMVMVAPSRTRSRTNGPVRILALAN